MSIELTQKELEVLTLALGLARGALHYIDPDQGPSARLLREVEDLNERILSQSPPPSSSMAAAS